MKRSKITIIIAVLFASLGLFQLLSADADATVYTIKKGDTPVKIAKKLGVSVESVIKSAGVGPRRLRPGARLVVPDLAAVRELPIGDAQVDSPAPQNILSPSEEAEETAEGGSDDTSPAPDLKNELISFAKRLINIPYKFGGTSILGIDCSGYVKKVYGI